MNKAKITFTLLFSLMAGVLLGEEYPHERPLLSDEKYQIELATCVDVGLEQFSQSLGFFDKIRMTEEKLAQKKQELSNLCKRDQQKILWQDQLEYDKAKREFEAKQRELERAAKLQEEAEKQERIRAEEATRHAAQALAMAQEKEAKAAADKAYAEQNAWKTYAFWGGGVALLILWFVVSSTIEKKRNEQISQRVQTDLSVLDANIKAANRGLTASFDNRDNISGYGAFLWSGYGCQVFGRKDVTKYKSMSAAYSRTGDRAREAHKIKGRGRVSVRGTRGKYEKVDEQVSLGTHNVYVTTEGLYVCGDYPVLVNRTSLIAFKIIGGNTIQLTFAGSKYPIEIQFPDWGHAEVCCTAMQNI
ncbi:MAG TPA: hypothetical protein VK165_03710 [Azonexus sp.]|nr:hypothetical protein [Azonexus sp.]